MAESIGSDGTRGGGTGTHDMQEVGGYQRREPSKGIRSFSWRKMHVVGMYDCMHGV
jgi:hypothetical protein